MTQEEQNAASAKPAPNLRDEIIRIIAIHSRCIDEANAGYLSGLWAAQFPDFPSKQQCSIIQELQRALEVSFIQNETLCHHCGWQWHPRTPTPKRCPRCLSYFWNIKKEETTPKLNVQEKSELL